MGWDSCSTWNTKQDVIKETLEGYEKSASHRILAYKSTSNALYIGIEATDDKGEKESFIAVYLIQRRGKELSRKGMSEHMGPFECDCPLELLELVPCPNNEYAREWREKVKAFHETKAKGKGIVSTLNKGETFELYGKRYVFERAIEGTKSIRACLEGTFQFFKISPKHFQHIQRKAG